MSFKHVPGRNGSIPHGDPLIHLLRNERIKQGLTIEDMAKRIGVGIGDLGNWELGKKSPRSLNFRAWLQALGFTICPPGASAAPVLDAPRGVMTAASAARPLWRTANAP